jgi:hypothetical protein
MGLSPDLDENWACVQTHGRPHCLSSGFHLVFLQRTAGTDRSEPTLPVAATALNMILIISLDEERSKGLYDENSAF